MSYTIGRNYFVRTMTFYYLGTLIEVTPGELVLKNAAMVIETGPNDVFMATGTSPTLDVGPYPDETEVILERSNVVECSTWDHPLIRAVSSPKKPLRSV